MVESILSPQFHHDSVDWLIDRIGALTDGINDRSIVDWAESVRYLPREVTDHPGFFNFRHTPYLRGIVECAGPDHPAREVGVMKGVQVGYSTGVLENILGYYIDEISTAPCMWASADAELAQDRLDSNIMPMIQQSGLSELIQSSDEFNARKTGKTQRKIEWKGGGSLRPVGAVNANKLRQFSILLLLIDELDGWPLQVGSKRAKQGDPDKLAFARTNGYADTRKVFRGSTPLITQTSKIYNHYLRGDQREYRVPCKKCGFKQALKWQGVNEKKNFGLLWETENGILVPGSVRYACQNCSAEWVNEDKALFLQEENGAGWHPTTKSIHPTIYSFHIHGMLAPVGNVSWEDQVREYMEAWDIEEGRPKDVEKLQIHYNNTLGWPFEERTEQVKYQDVIRQRRTAYSSGMIPNELALQETGGKIQFLTAAADIHKKHIDILVMGHCANGQTYSIDYYKVEHEWSDIYEGGWKTLTDVIEEKVYEDEDGMKYMVQITLVDSQWQGDAVYRYCAEFEYGVFPLQGRDNESTARKAAEFGTFETALGTQAWWVSVGRYKDRMAAALKNDWSGLGHQPKNHPNFPSDFPDYFFKELTKERKREVKNADNTTKKFEWYRPGNADNHAWDITIYNVAAREIVAWDTCVNVMGLTEGVDWPEFNRLCDEDNYFRTLTDSTSEG